MSEISKGVMEVQRIGGKRLRSVVSPSCMFSTDLACSSQHGFLHGMKKMEMLTSHSGEILIIMLIILRQDLNHVFVNPVRN